MCLSEHVEGCGEEDGQGEEVAGWELTAEYSSQGPSEAGGDGEDLDPGNGEKVGAWTLGRVFEEVEESGHRIGAFTAAATLWRGGWELRSCGG